MAPKPARGPHAIAATVALPTFERGAAAAPCAHAARLPLPASRPGAAVTGTELHSPPTRGSVLIDGLSAPVTHLHHCNIWWKEARRLMHKEPVPFWGDWIVCYSKY